MSPLTYPLCPIHAVGARQLSDRCEQAAHASDAALTCNQASRKQLPLYAARRTLRHARHAVVDATVVNTRMLYIASRNCRWKFALLASGH